MIKQQAKEMVLATREYLINHEVKHREMVYSSDLDLGRTWAMTLTLHAGSHKTQTQMFEKIFQELKIRFPKDCAVESFRHWLLGDVEHLCIRMINVFGNVTHAGAAFFQLLSHTETQFILELTEAPMK